MKKREAFGLSFFIGAGDRTRTGTPSLAADFESAPSTISSHRQVCNAIYLNSIVQIWKKSKQKFSTFPIPDKISLTSPKRIIIIYHVRIYPLGGKER